METTDLSLYPARVHHRCEGEDVIAKYAQHLPPTSVPTARPNSLVLRQETRPFPECRPKGASGINILCVSAADNRLQGFEKALQVKDKIVIADFYAEHVSLRAGNLSQH